MADALRMMAYGVPADFIDDNLAMGESTSIFFIKQFAKEVVELFGPEYLRAPNAQDTARLLEMNKACGFLNMLGCIDCMHWKWKNCPSAWQGMYSGHVHESTIILEAVASKDLWIWHAFLVYRDLTMISMFFTGLHCSRS